MFCRSAADTSEAPALSGLNTSKVILMSAFSCKHNADIDWSFV